MTDPPRFDLIDFTPYLLNIASENTSRAFQTLYRDKYGMLRTEWRVLFHLGRYGDMTAKEICLRGQIHKTKTSRAVTALEAKRFLSRSEVETDRRHERLTLTRLGRGTYRDLSASAQVFEDSLMSQFAPHERDVLRSCLRRLADLQGSFF